MTEPNEVLSFYHPSRPRMGNSPCWLSGTSVLPTVNLAPVPAKGTVFWWKIYIMLENPETKGFRWVGKQVHSEEVPRLLDWYYSDPEGFCREFLGEEPPVKPVRGARTPPKDLCQKYGGQGKGPGGVIDLELEL